MVPFYEAMTVHYIPAALHNAKAKIIEPYFNYLNKTYYQLEKNWSGVNINSRRGSQPNIEILNKNRHLIPDEEGACWRRYTASCKGSGPRSWKRTWPHGNAPPMERRMPFCDEEYLFLMGDTTGRTNRLTGKGLLIELFGGEDQLREFRHGAAQPFPRGLVRALRSRRSVAGAHRQCRIHQRAPAGKGNGGI